MKMLVRRFARRWPATVPRGRYGHFAADPLLDQPHRQGGVATHDRCHDGGGIAGQFGRTFLDVMAKPGHQARGFACWRSALDQPRRVRRSVGVRGPSRMPVARHRAPRPPEGGP
jgi:hypothetical protein